MSHVYHPNCGCSACCRVERLDDRRDEAIQALLDDARWVAANVAEADQWCDGSFDGEHYSAVERALADLGAVAPDRLVGSDALATVLRLAAIHHTARHAQLRMVAEAEIDRSQAA